MRDPHFNPRPPRGGRRCLDITQRYVRVISTHALLAEGDHQRLESTRLQEQISTHALLAEGDSMMPVASAAIMHFNPRPPRGGRPCIWPSPISLASYFNPRPPRGGRLQPLFHFPIQHIIFQPTPSSRRATFYCVLSAVPGGISTHALLAEGDGLHGCSIAGHGSHFNPRPPRGGRRLSQMLIATESPLFQPTPSSRRATLVSLCAEIKSSIFQPTPSSRRATTINRKRTSP